MKKDLVASYNKRGLESVDHKEIRIFHSYDKNSRTKIFERSQQNKDSLDLLIKIPSALIVAIGCPVRVLREVEAVCGDACMIVPKMSFGTVKSVSFHEKDYLLSTALVEFKIDDNIWSSNVEMVTEEFDLSGLNTNGFKYFFDHYSHRTFMPLSLAYSVTMTSLQGLEFDNLIFDLQDVGGWIRHVLYMGLTRVRSSRGIKCINIPSEDSLFNKNDQDISNLYSKLELIAARQSGCESNRNKSFLTLDFVQLLEKFKVNLQLDFVNLFFHQSRYEQISHFNRLYQPIQFDPKQSVESQVLQMVQDITK